MSYKSKMDLFYILKLNTSYIIRNNLNIELDFQDAKQNNFIISIGDNQLLKFIRQVKNIKFNRNVINDLYRERNKLKELKESKHNSFKIANIQNQINELLYVPDLISIKTDTAKKDYKNICKNYLTVTMHINDKVHTVTYKRICAGAGQLRRNSAFFVNIEIYEELEQIMMCGLNKRKIGKINLAKFSAYYALYTSATNRVTTPRVCVVNDFTYTLKNQRVSWIFDNDGEKDIEDKDIDMEINAFDGSGMISVAMAKRWQQDLGLDYLPSSFILRSAWIKGLVSVFDFHKFAEEVAETEYITDAWGNKKNINDIDVILTTSQFKMYKKYDNWEEYLFYHLKYHHTYGVARVNKKENNFVTPLNYQYIQSNEFSENSIKRLADFSVDWIKKIMSCEKLYTMLFLMGVQNNASELDDVENKLSSYIAKSLMYNDKILEDSYISRKIVQMIDKKINQIKIGKLFIEGSYDFAIPDLYAMAESAFGMEVKGLLGVKSIWNKRWVEKNSKVVSVMRSPLVAPSENQLMDIYIDDKCNEWYQYIQSGSIFNIWDTALIRASDADYDGDLVLTSDNEYLIEAVNDDLNLITYYKSKSKEQNLNFNNFANMDTKSFNSKIGFITNLASNFIAMMANYDKDSEEYIELSKRVNLLRFYQGSAIDATKGDIFIPPPKHWSKRRRYISLDGLEGEALENAILENKNIAFNNKICGYKKPYFFGYVYPKKLKEYKNHKHIYNQISEQKYGYKIRELEGLPEKTKEQLTLINKYRKYLPLLNNRCTMNMLSRYVEDVEIENKWNKKKVDFDYSVLMSGEYEITDKKMIADVFQVIKNFNRSQRINMSNRDYSLEYVDKPDEISNSIFSYLFEYYDNKLTDLCSNRVKLCDYVIYVFYNYFKNKSKSFLWNVFGETIFLNIKNKSSIATFPIEDINGEEYLGKKYSLKTVWVDIDVMEVDNIEF